MWSLFLFSFRYIQQIIRVFDGWITNAHKWSCTTLQTKKLQPRHFVSRWFAQTIQWWQGINVSEEMINPKVRWMLACKTGAIFFAFHRRARGGRGAGSMRGRGRRLPRRACLALWRLERASVGGREKGKEELSPSPPEEKRKKNSLILG